MVTATERPKRQKQVFQSASETAHVWAQQTQAYGRNPRGNLYFEGPTIYSYGDYFPLARFAGRGVVFVTRRRCTYSTNKHKRVVEAALSGLGVQVIRVNDVRPDANVSENVRILMADIVTIAKEHYKAHHRDRRDYLRSLIRDCAAYTHFMGQGGTAELASLVAAAETDPQFWARLAVCSRATALLLDSKKEERLWRAGADEAAFSGRHDARWDRRNELREAIGPLAVDAWRNGRTRVKLPADLCERFDDCLSLVEKERGVLVNQYKNYNNCPILLRIRGDEIETNRGERVTVEAAIRAWPYLRAHQVPPQLIGRHEARYFVANGGLHIGCHRIPVAEMNLIAAQLGLKGQIGESPAS